MRDLLEALLSVEGLAVTLAASGPEALELLRRNGEFDLVLTDLHLPGMEGLPLVHEVRGAMGKRALLVGMSGTGPAADVSDALDAFLLKPFDLDGLQRAIRAAQRRKGEPAGASARADSSGQHAAGEATRTGTVDAAEPAVAPLDENIFASLRRMLPGTQVRPLYDLTLSDVETRRARMEAAAAAGDLGTVQREAHAIKGSCGMVGATELQALAAALEGGTTVNTSALEQIPAASARLRGMLDGKLQTE